jgi:WD40 repeat protein
MDDALTLASPCAGGMVKLWDLTRGGSRELIGPNNGNQAVLCLSFSPDGSMLASGSVCDGLSLWDVATGRQLTTIRSENTSVRDVKFSNDGRMLIEVRLSGVVVLWDLVTKHKPTLQTKCSTSHCSSVSSDARFLAMGDNNGVLKVWDLTYAVNKSSDKNIPDR